MNSWYAKLYGPEGNPMCPVCNDDARRIGPLHGPCLPDKPLDNSTWGVERWGGWPIGQMPK